MPKGYPKDPEAVPDLPKKRGRPRKEPEVEGFTDAEPAPEVAEPKDTDATGEPRRKYKKRKSKDAKATPVRPELVAMAAKGALSISASAYTMFRAPRRLEFDPSEQLEFTRLLGEWAEVEGMELPLWVQVCIAGGVCIGTAVFRAETGTRGPIQPERILRAVSQFDVAQVPAASPLRPTPAHSDSGDAGVRENVVPSTLAPEQGTPSPSP